MLNKKRLKIAESSFLAQYPGGFEHPDMVAIGKKHRVSKLTEQAQLAFAKKAFKDSQAICEAMIKLVGRSSMVSMFEKPKFKGFVQRLNNDEKAFFAAAFKNLLHGDQAKGFEDMVGLLQTEKLAKWSLLTILPAYYAPEQEVFVKPTTAKNVIQQFEIPELVYKPLPTWDFYQRYRQMINEAKQQVDTRLSPSNPAFSGFLMMAMKMQGFEPIEKR